MPVARLNGRDGPGPPAMPNAGSHAISSPAAPPCGAGQRAVAGCCRAGWSMYRLRFDHPSHQLPQLVQQRETRIAELHPSRGQFDLHLAKRQGVHAAAACVCILRGELARPLQLQLLAKALHGRIEAKQTQVKSRGTRVPALKIHRRLGCKHRPRQGPQPPRSRGRTRNRSGRPARCSPPAPRPKNPPTWAALSKPVCKKPSASEYTTKPKAPQHLLAKQPGQVLALPQHGQQHHPG
jgi:hypothetical protein